MKRLFLSFILLLLAVNVFSQEKTLKRFIDLVIVPGSTAQCLSKLNPNKISLYSFKSGAFEKIPFQVDAKDDKGNFIINNNNTTISKYDEIAFLALDTGDKAEDNEINTNFPEKFVLEVEVLSNNEKGWIYIVSNDTPSTKQYIKYFSFGNKEEIKSDYYSISYKKNNIFFNTYSLTSKAGGNNTNIIDTMKLRFTIVTKLFSTSFTRNEKDLVYNVLGIKKGPVRIIRKVSSKLKVFLGLKSPAVIVDSYYTPFYLVVPSNLSVPFKLSYVAKDAYYRQTISYSDSVLGDKYYCGKCNTGLTLDGKMNNLEKSVKESPHVWGAIIGKTGNYLYRATWSKDMPLIKNLYYKDDKNVIDPLENEKGVHEIGFLLGDAIKLKPKKYFFSLSMYALPNWDKEILNEVLNVRNKPLLVKISNQWGKDFCK